MADTALDTLNAELAETNKRLDAFLASAPGRPTSTPAPTGPDTSAVWRHRLTAGRPHFVGPDDAPDANRRLLASVDRSLVDGVMATEPASAAKDRVEIAGLQGKLVVCPRSRLRNSWGWRLGAVLNSPGKHPFALDRRLDAGSGGPAARREVEVGLFRRVADRASEHRWVTDAGRAPRGVAGGALVMSPGVRAGRR